MEETTALLERMTDRFMNLSNAVDAAFTDAVEERDAWQKTMAGLMARVTPVQHHEYENVRREYQKAQAKVLALKPLVDLANK